MMSFIQSNRNITVVLLFLSVSIVALGGVIVRAFDADLDLASRLESIAPLVEQETGQPLLEYAPRMVVGQGDDAANYTVIRILNKYQIAQLQFLAYPSSVRGGVNVAAGKLYSEEMAIVACPISDSSTRQIRIFEDSGELVGAFSVDTVLEPPFVIATGNFATGNDNDEIAVASLNQRQTNRNILIYNAEGSLSHTVQSPLPYSGANEKVVMNSIRGVEGDKLLLYYQDSKFAFVVNPATGAFTKRNLNSLPDGSGVYPSAFDDQLFVAGADEPFYSTLHIVDDKGDISSVDAGRRENRFWIASYYDSWDDSEYVKNSRFRHIRTEHLSDNYRNTDFDADNYTDWVGSYAENSISDLLDDYYSDPPSMWEPTFTHRQHATQWTVNWLDVVDQESGFRKYAMLSRFNTIMVDVEGFYCFTYAPGLPALDRLYRWPQREFLRQLGLRFRGEQGHPEHLVGVEPSHEFEIISGGNLSIGDYNPKMISSFYSHLVKRYKSIGRVNELYGTSFSVSNFDAPRNLNRGSWDSYNIANGYFNEWVEYNRKMIFERIAQGFEEALIAGFPPEAIKTHQIPQGYAVGQPISSYRITPIDWIFSAGTGYGGTRYGVWYSNPVNWIQGARSSGQSMISVGEYDSLTTNEATAINQLVYMFDNGVNFIHSMGMSSDTMNRNATLALQNEGARPGTTGGIGQIRAAVVPNTLGKKTYNIVCVGSGENREGLLKSVNSYGGWEGTVYAVPFRSAIEIVPVGSEERSFNLTSSQYNTGNISGLKAGDQIEVRFNARTQNSNGMVTLLLLHEGMEIQRHHINIAQDWGFNRYVLRLQSVMGNVAILMNSGKRDTPTGFNQNIEFEAFSVLVHKEQVARKQYNITEGVANSGGVTFDILSADYLKYYCSVVGDLNGDCRVDVEDFGIFAQHWLSN